MEGLFNITNFEEAGKDDLLKMNLNESTEIQDKCPSMNPTEHFDAANSGNKEIPVPGGDKEQPTASEHKEQEIPVPGGDKEKPDAKPADGESGEPKPAKVLLDSDAYNAALNRLQQSFKEASDLVAFIQGATVINESVEEMQERYMENAADTSFLEFCDTVMFEKVLKEDKKEIKDIVDALRSKAASFVDDQKADYKFYKPHTFARFLLTAGTDIKAWQHIWNTRMWQVLGCVTCEDANIDTLTKAMTKEFKDELDDYKIISMKAVPSILDLFRIKFGFKNQLEVFFLLIDKKIPAELEKADKELEEAVAKKAK